MLQCNAVSITVDVNCNYKCEDARALYIRTTKNIQFTLGVGNKITGVTLTLMRRATKQNDRIN